MSHSVNKGNYSITVIGVVLSIIFFLLFSPLLHAQEHFFTGTYFYQAGGSGCASNNGSFGSSGAAACSAAGASHGPQSSTYPTKCGVGSAPTVRRCNNPCYDNGDPDDGYDPISQTCAPPPPEPCPEGTVRLPWVSVPGEPTQYSDECTFLLPEIPDDSEYPLDSNSCDVFTGVYKSTLGIRKAVCAEAETDCATYGTFAINGVEEQICIPPNAYRDPPENGGCQTGEVLRHNEITGDQWCSPLTPAKKDVPGIEEGETDDKKDTDGDGTPDHNDSDIDGDGVSNSNDNDRDGDGIDDPNDPSPNGEKPSSVSGGGDCNVAPSCQGDAIWCAVNFQVWKLRCESEPTSDYDEEISSMTPDRLRSETDLTSEMQGIFNVSGSTGTCPSPTPINVVGTTIELDYQPFCDLAGLIRPIVLILFGLISFRVIMRAF